MSYLRSTKWIICGAAAVSLCCSALVYRAALHDKHPEPVLASVVPGILMFLWVLFCVWLDRPQYTYVDVPDSRDPDSSWALRQSNYGIWQIQDEDDDWVNLYDPHWDSSHEEDHFWESVREFRDYDKAHGLPTVPMRFTKEP